MTNTYPTTTIQDVCKINKNIYKADLLWINNKKVKLNSTYLIKYKSKIIPASILKIKNNHDSKNSMLLNHTPKNKIISCEILTSENINTPSKQNKKLASFLLIDRNTKKTSACGIIHFNSL